MAILRPLPPIQKVDPDKDEKKKGPMVVNVANDPTDGSRIVTIKIPQMKVYTEEQRRQKEEYNGASALAQCDATGELIFSADNVNKIESSRPEFKDVCFSTKFLRLLIKAIQNPNTVQTEQEARV